MESDEDSLHVPDGETKRKPQFHHPMIHSLRTRLVLGYLSIVALLAVSSVATVLVTRQVRAGYEDTVQVDDAAVTQIMLRVKLMDDEETSIRGYSLTGNPVFLQPYARAQPALRVARLHSLRLLAHQSHVIPLLVTMSSRARMWEQWAKPLLTQQTRSWNRVDLNARMLRGKVLFDAYRVASDRVLHYLDIDRQRHLATDARFLDQIQLGLAALLPLALASIVGVAWRTTKAITQPLARLQVAAIAIGRSDFTYPVSGEQITEFAALAMAMDRMRRQLNSQRELTRIIGSTLQIEQVYETFATLLRELVSFDRLSISLADGNDMLTVFGTGAGTNVIPTGTRLPMASVATAHAYRTGDCVVQPDLTSVLPEALLEDEQRARAAGICSYVVIPLLTKGRIIGTLTLGSRETGAYTHHTLHDDLGPVLSLAPLIASAVDNAHLYTSLDTANEDLARMHAEEFARARRDALTGRGNRLLLREDLDALSKQSYYSDQTYSLAMCDVDHFKAYNDRYGHAAGDAVLRAVATSLARHARQGDRVYRYGGEEFLLIFPDQDLESAALVAERLRQGVEDLALPHAARNPANLVTISVGVAAMGLDDPQSIDRLLKDADSALYRAKQAGRNCVSVDGGGNRILRLVPTATGSSARAAG